MKKTFTLLMFFVIGVLQVGAQINSGSVIPIDFIIESPINIAGTYAYGTQTAEWGPTLGQTVTGEVVWAYDDVDSLCCMPVTNDLTGKMALIRRGICNFSLKTYHAQQAGAIGVIICNHYTDPANDDDDVLGMLGGDSASAVVIPAIFVSRNTCETILSVLDNGGTVVASFEAGKFGGPHAYYQYNSPLSAMVNLKDVGVSYFNTTTDTVPSVTVNVDFEDPAGNVTTLSKTLTNVPPLSGNSVILDDSYVPAMLGEYNAHFSYSAGDETYDRKFFISGYTYAQDNDVIDTTQAPGGGYNAYNGTLENDSLDYVDIDKLIYHFGNFYRTGTQTQVATHLTFILANYNEMWTGDPEADLFQIRIYDADPDGNGFVPDSLTYDELNEDTEVNPPVGGADYYLDGATPDFTVTTVELEEPITLGPNKIYLAMVQYDGLPAATGITPKPAVGIGTNYNVAGGLSSARYGDRFHRDGWSATSNKFIVRLHLDGYLTGTEEPLDKSKISLSPNPATDVVRLQLDLEKSASEVTVRIMDFNGRLLRTEQFENVQKGTYAINVRDLANGAYFMTVVTPEGFRSKKFQVMR